MTTIISAGEVHAPGRLKNITGLKAMTIASQRWCEIFHPSGVKMNAGAPVLEEGMEEYDFKDWPKPAYPPSGFFGSDCHLD